MLERPITTASRPASDECTVLASRTHPIGVHGTRAGKPLARRPTLSGWKPSTSLAGSMAAIILCASICFGSGSCTRMPLTCSSPLSAAMRLISSASLVVAGKFAVEGLHAGFRHGLGFVADVDLACGVLADQNNGEAGHDAAIATQAMDGIRHLATQVRGDCLAVDNTCGHLLLIAGLVPAIPIHLVRLCHPKRDGRDKPGHDYRVVENFSSAAITVGPSPEMASRLRRAVAPATSVTSRDGTPTAFAIKRMRASLASPSAGSARTRAASTARPSASTSMPSIASRPPFGVSRTANATPSGRQRPRDGRHPSEHVGVDVPDDDVFEEQDDQNQDHRRYVNSAEVGQQRTYWTQQRAR